MIRVLYLIFVAIFFVSTGHAQCPTFESRNNGNNLGVCAGSGGSAPAEATNIPGTSYQYSSCCGSLTKQGNFTAVYSGTVTPSFEPAVSAIYVGTTLSSAVMGPPTSFTPVGGNRSIDYCFFGINLPTSGNFTLVYVNPLTNAVYATCTYVGCTGAGCTSAPVTPPTITTQPVGATKCVGDTYTWSVAATPTNTANTIRYQWKKNGADLSGATNSTYTISSIVSGDAGTYSVQVIESNGAMTASNNTTLTVSGTPPTISAGSNVAICTGSSTTLTATGGVTYTWAPSTALTATTGASVTANPTSNTTYTVTGSNGCSSTATVTVSVSALPATVTGNATLSTAITTTLANATAGGTWSSVSTGVATIGTNGVVTGVSAGTSVISYTMAGGCAATQTVTVNTPANALNFDGTNDYVAVANNSAFETSTGTLEMWIRPNWVSGTRSGNPCFVSMRPTTLSNTRYSYHINNNLNGLGLWNGSSYQQVSFTFTQGTWYHVALVYSTTSTAVYINGTLIGSTSNGIQAVAGNEFRIGMADNGFFSEAWLGNIDEVRVWNTTRTQNQIQANMNCDIAQQAGLIAYYRFNQGTAAGTNTGLTCAYDYSGNSYSGSLTNFALSGSSSNYVTGAVGNCNTATPVAPGSFSGNTPVCVGSTITLANANTGGVWSTASGNITINSTSGLVTGVTAGTATVNYTLNCSSSSAIVTINALPTVSGSANVTICSGSSTVISAGGASTYTWSPGTALSATTGNSITASPTSTITYTVTGTNSNGCANTATVQVSVNPSPSVNSVSNVAYCTGATTSPITFSGPVGGTTFTWANNNTAIGLGAGSGTVCGTAAEGGTVVMTAPAGAVFTSVTFASYGTPTGSCGSFAIGGCHAASSLSVVQGYLLGNNSASIPATNGVFGDPCGGTFKQLYIQATYTTSGNLPSFTATNSGSSAITGTITVTPAANGCTGTPGTFTVTVNPYPVVAAITGNTTLSTAIRTTLADATASGVWSSGATGVATVGSSTGVVTGVSAGTALISYTVTNSGCSTTVTTNVTVKTPNNALNLDGSSDYVSVSGSTGIPSGNGQYTIEAWIKPTSGGVYGIAGWGNYGTNNQVTAFRLHNSTTLHHYWWFNDLSATVPNLVDGNWHHVACTFNGTTRAIYCDGALVASDAPSGHNVTVTNNVTVGRTYNAEYFPGGLDEVRIWNVGRTQSQIQANMNCDVSQQAGLVAYYRFDQGTASGTNTGLTCAYDYSGNANTGTLNTFGLSGGSSNYITGAVGTCNTATPVAPGSFSGNSPVCVGSTITLTNANTGGVWSTASGNITINSTSGLVTGVTAGTATVNYTLNCSSSSVVVTINAVPTVAAITGTTTLTVYNTTTLSNATPSGVWASSATGTATVNSTSGVVSGVAEGTAMISYTVTNGSGCSTTVTTNVTVSGHNGVKFDGTNDYMILPDIHSAINGTSVTVELWFRANAAGVIVNELGSPGVGSGWHDTWIEVLATGEVKVRVWNLGSVSLGTVSFGTWHHVALRHNATTNRLDGLLDGVPSSSSSSGSRSTSGAVFLAFGIADAQNLGSGAYLNGTIDEVRIWNLALCDGEIVNNMSGRLSGPQTGLVAYYTLDQGIGGGTNTGLTTAIDYSGNGRNATLNNIALTGTSSNWVTGTVNALAAPFTSPTITASSNVTICNGSSTTLTVSGGTAYQWTPSTGLSVTTGSSVTASPSSTITYTVTDECGGTATVQVSVNPTPSTSGGANTAICIGSSTSLTASGAAAYTWAPSASLSASTGSNVTATPTVTTTYTVTGTNAFGCSAPATVTVSVNPYSAVYSITGGGPYCAGTAGSTIGLSGSDVGINYQLYKGASTSGSPVAGTGSAISFGPRTLSGSYTVVAIGAPSPGCTNSMTGSTSVSILTSPAAVAVLGGGSVCGGGPGVSIYLGGSAVGIDYQLYLGATPVGSPLGGVGTSLSFGTFTTLGTYTVTATNPLNGCSNNMLGSALITAASGITAYAMTGGGSYCTGGSGVNIGLANSTSGLSYQLFLGTTAMGSAVTGTGSAISFGLQTIAGTYTVVGTNTTTGCFGNMTGSVTVSIDPLPNIYTVTGGGSYCAGGAGLPVGLSLSDVGVDYQLYNGASPVGSPVAGTGAAISFGSQTTAGTYTVVATDGTTTCTNTMGGSVTVVVNALPTVTTGAGAVICAGSPAGLTAGGAVNYAWSPATALTATTGSSVTANPTTTTTYTVTGTDANGCVNTAAVTVTVNTLPTVSGGAGVAICNGSSTGLTASGALTYVWSPATALSATTGASVTANPTTTTTYSVTGTDGNGCENTATVTVTVNAIPTVTPSSGVTICSGLNTTLTASGATTYTWAPATALSASTGVSVTASPTVTTTYTVTGTDAIGCVNTAVVTVSVNPTPNDYAITGGGSFCSSTAGTAIGLAGSDVGVNYQLYTAGLPVGSPVAGTGAAVSFGLHTASGVYTVVATNAVSGCTFNISGSVSLTSYPSPAPVAMIGGGAYCFGGTGVSVGISGSAIGVNYQLYRGGSPVGSPVAGIGMGFNFGLYTTAGTYTVVATNVITGCTTNATGTAVVAVHSALATHTVTGGGNYCSGGSGVAVGLNGSDVGVNYQLYRGGLPLVGTTIAGTGSALSFGAQTTAGVYTVVAVNSTTGCAANMSGSATVIVNPLPTVYTVTGGGSYCIGGSGFAIGLSNSDIGVDYQLYSGVTPVGSPVSGTGAAISFGTHTKAGTYSVVATNASTTCTNNMTGSATIIVNANPAVFTIGGGGSYCSGTGLYISLSGSTGSTTYQLFNGASPVGSPVSGTGAILSFGPFTTPGNYTIVATSTITSCTSNMSGSATITGVSLPNTYNVTGGGNYCSGGTGVAVGLSNSDLGINYQLYRGATAVGSAVAGTGAAISFGMHTTAGTYTVIATNASLGCTSTMTGSAVVAINALPTAAAMTGGGAYCTGGSGVSIGLSGSAVGIDYQLYRGVTAIGSPIAGTGSALSFGVHTTAGTYTAVATNTVTACVSNMSGTAVVTINPLPVAYTVTGGGSYCSGGVGVVVGLSNSQVGVSYQLYNGASAVGSPVSGSGIALTFGIQAAAGTYTVVAINTSTGCVNNMTGNATVTINALPTVYTVTGGGAYCIGGTGSAVGLSGSDAGIDYQLYNGSLTVGSPVAGTGGSINFGTFTSAATYTVTATNTTTGCVKNMSGSASVTVNSLPAPVLVTGGGTICIGGTGVAVGLAASASGISYQLYVGGSPTGSPVIGIGGALTFGMQTTIGTYTAVGTHPTTGCSNNMIGSVVIANYTPPTAFAVTGGGSYCTGGTGVVVGLAGSATGVTYQLYRGATAIGSPVMGTGAALSFGLHTTAGTYTVVATTTSNGCTGNMTGSAVISLNPLPSVYTVTGGGSYCSGGTGVSVGVSNSDIGTNYQLYNGVTPVGSAVAGTGAAISFGLQTTAGTYTVAATIAATSCTGNMTGSAVISIDPLPTAYTVTGGGSYCSGPGVHVYLSNSATGVSYQLYRGATPVGSPVAGTGAALDFGGFTALGTYTVVATNAATSCVNNMSGSAVISGFALPAIYTVTGGGGYCSGGAGALVGLSNSDLGVDYQLYLGATPVGGTVAGTGSAISFGPQATTGTYTVLAINSGSSCTSNMSGSATVSITALPTAYTVTGGGSYCLGGTGVAVGLSSSASGVNYQLYNGVTAIGSPVAGTGSAISFGQQTTVGTYTVVATDGTTTCTNNMTGSATISTVGLPTAYTVTGGGSFCAGGTGATISLSGSQTGVIYQLYNGASAVGAAVAGTGSSLSFGLHTTAGTYTVVATNTSTTCSATMSGSVAITTLALPTVYAFTGGGGYCSGGSGVTLGLAGSDVGITYQLYLGSMAVGSAVSGTGSAISFGTHTTGGTYTILATNTVTGCSVSMGSNTITVYALPAATTVSGGGAYCSGGTGATIWLPGSGVGVNYQLYLGATPVGSPVAGVGTYLSLGTHTTTGTYTVVATNVATGCTNNMTGSATISIHAPLTTYTVTGGGSYCIGGTGVVVGLSGSATGVEYKAYRDGLPLIGSVSGTGSAISFGLQTIAGTYTVIATNTTTTCTSNMSGGATVAINALPTAYTVTGGGSYCTGGSGVAVGLSNSTTGVNYQLYRGTTAVGSPVAGTGAAISFGSQTTAGTYTVAALDATTGCSNNMSGSVSVSINSLPAAFTVTGGGSYCAGGSTGPNIYLSGCTGLTTYQLYLGATPVGTPVAATGGSINFGSFTTVGTYSVTATSTLTGCTNNMNGSATISTIPLPVVYTVTGGGSYCTGGSGVAIGLSSSNTGISYQLYRGVTPVGAALTGTGSALSFGVHTTAGTYTVVATVIGTFCTSNMSGSAVVSIDPLPVAFSVTGGGSYCTGGTGVSIGLSSSVSGTNYQLYRGATLVGSPVSGTGSAISYGLHTTAGTYTVVATIAATGCVSNMTGSATVSVNALPTAYTVTGGGSYCSGGTGVIVGLSGSQGGTTYQLFIGGSPVGSPVSGSGAAINFGLRTVAGAYSVVATNTSTTCTNNMAGSVTVSVNALPTVYAVTGGGGYCSGGTGVAVGLSASQTGVNYQLYRGTSAVGSPVAGNGSALNFGSQTVAGTYTVKATDAATGCFINMSGSASVTINSAPTVCSMTGGGGYCSGGTGVAVGISASITGVSYQLYLAGSPVGSPVSGTGAGFSFGLQIVAGTYTAVATNTAGCSATMSGSATVVVHSLPAAYTVTGGGSYCSGGTGVNIGLSGSASTAMYRLMMGTTPVSSYIYGSGSALNFGKYTAAGTYTVQATTVTTGCTTTMSGNATVTINPIPTITGSYYTVAPGSTRTLTGSPTGGVWTSTAPSIATVGSSSGIVSGVALGSTYIYYTVSGCVGYRIFWVTPTGFREAAPDTTTSATAVFKGENIYIAPNPTRGIFMIRGSLGAANAPEAVTLDVTNMLGQVIHSNAVTTKDGVIDEQVHLPSSLPNGMYIVTLRAGGESKVFHMVVER